VDKGDKEDKGDMGRQKISNNLTYAQCPMLHAQCPMPHAPCPMPKKTVNRELSIRILLFIINNSDFKLKA
jgi:hypothetical protein